MKTLISWLVCSQILCATDIPSLHFNDRITWKQIFDFGFRPKHLEGLESHKCVCYNQEFTLQFKDRGLKFKLDKGSIDFGFFFDDFLQMIWHQGNEPLTLEEGKRRADEFRKVFDGYIIQEITMPRLIDPSGLVDAGNDENNVKVRVGEYLIWYGFDNSLRKDKPLKPHFYIVWSFPGRPDVRLKDSGDVVRPPKGYEWYSLDPKASTPDPVPTPVTSPDADIKNSEKEKPAQPKVEAKSLRPENSEVVKDESRWIKWLLGIFGLTVATVIVWRWKSKST